MPTTKPFIAVVDDDQSVIKSLTRTLRSAGYDVGTFASAREFLGSLLTSLPQCLVLDVHMPEMSGLELQELLVAQGSCLPVILMTAYDTPETRERAHRQGAAGLLLKPFANAVLLHTIQAALSCHSQDPAAGGE